MDKVSMTACDLHDKNFMLKTAVDRLPGHTATFENTPAGRKTAMAKLKKEAAELGCKRIVFAYEAGGQGFQFYDELSEAGIECYVLAPTKIARSEKHKRSKTDAKDCERILELLRGHVLGGNPLPAVHVPGLQQRDDREATRCRLDLADELKKLKTKIKCLLKRNGVQSPSELGKGLTRKRKQWLNDQAKGEGALKSSAQTVLASLLRRVETTAKEIEILDGHIETLSEAERYSKAVKSLRKLKGVGLLSAMVFLAEIGDPGRFSNRRKVGAYVGLAPSSYESGANQDRKGHITRQGSSHIRRILCQCVWSRIRTDPDERVVYERLISKNAKKKKIAVVALMRRLVIRMWHAASNVAAA